MLKKFIFRVNRVDLLKLFAVLSLFFKWSLNKKFNWSHNYTKMSNYIPLNASSRTQLIWCQKLKPVFLMQIYQFLVYQADRNLRYRPFLNKFKQ